MFKKTEKSIKHTEIVQYENTVDNLAASLHPDVQHLVLSKITDLQSGYIEFLFKSDILAGTKKLAVFRPGQFITFDIEMNGVKTTRSFPLVSSPLDARSGFYKIILKREISDRVGNFILKNWKEGQKFSIGAPSGNFYYEKLRDFSNVVAVAFGSGVFPFMSMAKAIYEGDENFNLTLFYESNRAKNLVFKKFFDWIASRTDKVKVIYILENENLSGCKKGIVNRDMIEENVEGGYSIFLSGSQKFYEYMKNQYLNYPPKLYRTFDLKQSVDILSQKNYPKFVSSEVFNIQVKCRDGIKVIQCMKNQTILSALEKNGINVPSSCRSGKCALCHTKIVAGQVYIPDDFDGRRIADFKYGYIHPCCSYPLSNLILVVKDC